MENKMGKVVHLEEWILKNNYRKLLRTLSNHELVKMIDGMICSIKNTKLNKEKTIKSLILFQEVSQRIQSETPLHLEKDFQTKLKLL